MFKSVLWNAFRQYSNGQISCSAGEISKLFPTPWGSIQLCMQVKTTFYSIPWHRALFEKQAWARVSGMGCATYAVFNAAPPRGAPLWNHPLQFSLPSPSGFIPWFFLSLQTKWCWLSMPCLSLVRFSSLFHSSSSSGNGVHSNFNSEISSFFFLFFFCENCW